MIVAIPCQMDQLLGPAARSKRTRSNAVRQTVHRRRQVYRRQDVLELTLMRRLCAPAAASRPDSNGLRQPDELADQTNGCTDRQTDGRAAGWLAGRDRVANSSAESREKKLPPINWNRRCCLRCPLAAAYLMQKTNCVSNQPVQVSARPDTLHRPSSNWPASQSVGRSCILI